MAITITSPGGKAEVSGPRWFVETTSTADTLVVGANTQTATASSRNYSVGVETGVVIGGIPYTGSYDSTPSWDEQVLATRAKTMADDVTVHSITKLEVGNAAGGLTLTI